MPVILAFLGIAASALFYLIVIYRGSQVLGGLLSGLGTIFGLARWKFWKYRNIKEPHELIDTPVLSATSLLLVLLRFEGEMTDRQRHFLHQTMGQTFKMPADEMDDQIAQARFAIHKVNNANRFFKAQAQFLKPKLGPIERQELLLALNKAATLEGDISVDQQQAIKVISSHFQSI